jgi:uncharacterized damage-inducible protein DinB
MKDTISINPRAGFDPRIGTYLAQLEDVRERTKRYVQGLSPSQLAWHPNPKVESIGTLLLHIAAVELSWIQEDIMRKPMGEEWKIGFPIRFGIPQVSGEPLEFFLGKLDSTRTVTRDVLAWLSDADLSRSVTSLDDSESQDTPQYAIEWILYHLVEHEAHHKGQIAVMKRLLPDAVL